MPYLSDEELFKSARGIKTGDLSPAPVYLIHGSETWYSGQCLNRLTAALVKKGTESFNYRKFSDERLDISAIKTECETLPLMADYKCVLIPNPNLEALSEKERKAFFELAEDPNPTTVLIVYISAYELNPKKNPLHKKLIDTFAKAGTVTEVNRKSRSELTRHLRQKCQKAGCTLGQSAAEKLIDRCGMSLEILEKETDKLIDYRPGGEITRADVELVTRKSIDASIYDLTKALLGRNRRADPFTILDELFAQREKPTSILGALSSSFIDLYRAKAAINSGKSQEDILSLYRYGGRAFAVENAFRDAPKYSMKQLRESLGILLKTETAIKSGRDDDRLLIEEALSQILALANT